MAKEFINLRKNCKMRIRIAMVMYGMSFSEKLVIK